MKVKLFSSWQRNTRALATLFGMIAMFASAANATDSLNFFNNWFVTGDYAVAGVGLRGTGVNGTATGTINLSGVPAGAEPVAAFLYWSTIESAATQQATNGVFDGHKILGVVLGSLQNPGCFSSGGNSGGFGRVYRSDVLRYLPVNSSNIRQANGSHTVGLPDSGGNGNGNLLFTNGASLVVIYRVIVTGNPAAAPLKSVVIYNGAFTTDKHSAGLTQSVAGFYQAASLGANPNASITNIVANGQAGFSSTLSVNGTNLSTSPFVGSAGAYWDNPTYNFTLAADASFFSTQVSAVSNQTCLTWSAIVSSVTVKDTDGDGLLDIWETNGLHRNTQVSPATFGTCLDYPSEPCVNLPAMGADKNTSDIFLQLDWMHGTSGGGGTDGAGTHDHMPKLPALDVVAKTFAGRGIKLHFDAGNNYQGSQSTCGNVPCRYIIPAAYAQGGADIDENTLVCHDTPNHPCAYHQPYPVLSFEFGFASVRDGNQKANISRHLAQNRRDVFRYSLFAHTLAGPFDANGKPVDPATNQPATAPKSYSGIAQRPGGGFMVTLGLWRSDFPENDQVGSVLVQAGTLMHELGHTLSLSHGGLSTRPNCMPNYPSVMNYLYQTRGLTDAAGASHIDYSDGVLGGLNENAVSESAPLGNLKYRLRYYGPFNSALDPPGAPAKLTCDGKPTAGLPQMVRRENTSASFIDFDHNGTLTAGTFSQDLNFDAVLGEVFADQPDWTSLNLQQIGTGPNFGGVSVGAFATDGGVFATDGGVFATDAGALATDAGVFATDGGAFATDAGAFATDGGVFATDGGVFATDGGAFATDAGDLDFETVLLSSIDPPPPPGSCPTCGLMATSKVDRITLSWTAPDTGHIASYNIYRSDPAHPVPVLLTSVPGGSPVTSYDDVVNSSSTLYNTTYTYTVTSVVVILSQLNESLPSTPASGQVKHLFITANNQTRAYGDPNPVLTASISGMDPATLTSAPVCTTTAISSSPVGSSYPIHCTAASTSSVDALSFVDGTLTITRRIVTPSITAGNKTYDGTTKATVSCTVTNKAGSDDVACVVSAANFASASAGAWTVNATGITLTGATAGNYTLNGATTAATTATINARPATVTADNKIKVYGTANPALTASAAGTVNGDTLNFSLSTAAATLSGVGTYPITVTLGTNPNYSVTPAGGTLTVNKAVATVTLGNLNQTYTGTPLSPTATVAPGVSFSWTGAPQTNGTYSVTATVTDPNYTGSASRTFTIGKVPVTVTADNKTRPEFAANPPLTATYSGFRNGQTLATSGITGTPNLTTTATTNSDEGSYLITITIGTLASGNYTFTFVNGKLTVTE